MVASSGRELCSIFVVDTDWSSSYTATNAVGVTVYPPSGWAPVGQCSLFWWDPKTRVSNYTYYQAVNGSQSDDVTQDAWEQLP